MNWTVALENCTKSFKTKHFTEKPILLNFTNLSAIFYPGFLLYYFNKVMQSSFTVTMSQLKSGLGMYSFDKQANFHGSTATWNNNKLVKHTINQIKKRLGMGSKRIYGGRTLDL